MRIFSNAVDGAPGAPHPAGISAVLMTRANLKERRNMDASIRRSTLGRFVRSLPAT